MKTKLPTKISTIEEAKDYLTELFNNGEAYHPEDLADGIHWTTCQPTPEECTQLDNLMCDIYNLPGNDGRHSGEMAFEPCEYLNDLDKIFLHIDFSGGGVTDKLNRYELKKILVDEINGDKGLQEYLYDAELGAEYESNYFKLVRL